MSKNLNGRHCPNSTVDCAPSCVHDWKKEMHSDNVFYYCALCGAFSKSQPEEYVSESSDDENEDTEDVKKCVHNWVCLRDRCHNRGNGKYKAYRCSLCNKFQRR